MTRRDEADRLLASRLRHERLLAGKSREELGSALGTSAQRIRDYETGAERLPARFIAAAVRTLGVPLRMLCYGADDCGPSQHDDDGREPPLRLAIRRPPSVLNHPEFSNVLPIVGLWQSTRGELTEHVSEAVTARGLSQRMILVRRPAGSERMIIQHFGPGIKIMRPCETLVVTERDFDNHHTDRAYGAWVSRAYAETLRHQHLRIECIRALVSTSADGILHTRYDRLLMPWHGRGGDQYAMALSIQREVPVPPRPDLRRLRPASQIALEPT